MNSTKLISTYSKSLFQNSNNSSSFEALKESFDVSKITSPEQTALPATIYVLGEELLLIRSTLISSKSLKEFFQNPTYAEKQKLEILLTIFPGLTVTMKSFLKILAERSHLSLLPSICEEYTLILLKFKRSTKVRLVIAQIIAVVSPKGI